MAEYIDRNTAIAKVTALEVIEPLSTRDTINNNANKKID